MRGRKEAKGRAMDGEIIGIYPWIGWHFAASFWIADTVDSIWTI